MTTKGKMKPIRGWMLVCNSICACGELEVYLEESKAFAESKKAKELGGHLKVIQVEIRPVNNPPTKRK